MSLAGLGSATLYVAREVVVGLTEQRIVYSVRREEAWGSGGPGARRRPQSQRAATAVAQVCEVSALDWRGPLSL